MKKSFVFLMSLALSYGYAQDSKTVRDSTKTESLGEILVKAVRVDADSPITHSNVSKEALSKRNLGQDIPALLKYLPSVVSTSDAGAGVGYTSIRVRGSGASRVNVTINGIPYNDSESQGSFWINLGDFASSTQSMQLQRGVGTSTNGSAAFGASLNILTDTFSTDASAVIANSFGSYNTRKHTVKLNTGNLIKDDTGQKLEVSGRFSKIYSDGYVDRAFTDLKSYFLQGVYKNNTTLIKALTFGNKERTYQAWAGLTQKQLDENRRQNPYTYDDQTDNYWQDHYQLHWNERLSNRWSTTLGLNYTKGKGYFENLKTNEAISRYLGIVEATVLNNGDPVTDVVERRWLDNNFYVINANARYKNNGLEIISGMSYSAYDGDHFGEVIWARKFSESANKDDRFYDGDASKKDFNIFSKGTLKFSEKLIGFLDLQGRFVRYKTNGSSSKKTPFVTDAAFDFFNPKAGFTYKGNEKNSYYLSYAHAHREPSRDDFQADVSAPEILNDMELGWRYHSSKLILNTNLYYMFYKDQLVLTGELDDVGAPIRASSGKSYRLGLEIDATAVLSKTLSNTFNIAVSRNKNRNFKTTIDGQLVTLGETNISFSPSLVIGNTLNYHPTKRLEIALLSKYVGEQYLGNVDHKSSKLSSYFTNDFNINYEINPKQIFKAIRFSGLVNNIFNKRYVSNGYFGSGTSEDAKSPTGFRTAYYTGYYPQATINFLAGVTLIF